MHRPFNVTFEVVTHESAEHGDVTDAGFAAQACSLREALEIAGGPFENAGRWFTTVDAEIDYQTGEHTTYAIHPPDSVTPSSYARLARLLDC